MCSKLLRFGTFLSDLNLIKNIIKSSGYYFAQIKTTSILNEEQNSIRLIYDIDLGKRAKINEIQFIGDKKVKDRTRNIIKKILFFINKIALLIIKKIIILYINLNYLKSRFCFI